MSCAWFYLGSGLTIDSPVISPDGVVSVGAMSWMAANQGIIAKMPVFEQYVMSLYWATKTLTTTGIGMPLHDCSTTRHQFFVLILF
jgi:hypothetical protein